MATPNNPARVHDAGSLWPGAEVPAQQAACQRMHWGCQTEDRDLHQDRVSVASVASVGTIRNNSRNSNAAQFTICYCFVNYRLTLVDKLFFCWSRLLACGTAPIHQRHKIDVCLLKKSLIAGAVCNQIRTSSRCVCFDQSLVMVVQVWPGFVPIKQGGGQIYLVSDMINFTSFLHLGRSRTSSFRNPILIFSSTWFLHVFRYRPRFLSPSSLKVSAFLRASSSSLHLIWHPPETVTAPFTWRK